MSQVILRAATLDDADRLLRWRNDTDAVRFSRSGRAVAAAEHRSWLSAALAGSSTRVWVAVDRGIPVGEVRLDLHGDEAEVDIAVDPASRGHGVASAMLADLQTSLDSLEVKRLVAHVHRDNVASRRLFTSARFQLAGEVGDFLILGWPM